jgi:hypothetical protein
MNKFMTQIKWWICERGKFFGSVILALLLLLIIVIVGGAFIGVVITIDKLAGINSWIDAHERPVAIVFCSLIIGFAVFAFGWVGTGWYESICPYNNITPTVEEVECPHCKGRGWIAKEPDDEKDKVQ